MKINKRAGFLAVVAMVFGLSACAQQSTDNARMNDGSEGEVKEFQVGHVQSTTDLAFFHVFTTEFAQRVEEYSDGAIQVEVIPAGQLGGERVMTEGMQLGTTDAAAISSFQLGNFTSSLSTFDLPFLLDDYDTAHAMLNSDIMEPFEQDLRDEGLVTLAWGSGGFRSMVSNLGEVETLHDFQDIKIRLPESRIYMRSFDALGANPLPMAFGEVVPALQQGTIDATENSLQGIYEQRWHEVARDVTVTRHFFSPIPLMMGEDLWNTFNAEEHEILIRAAEEAAAYEHDFVAETDELAAEMLTEEGARLTVPQSSQLREATVGLYADFYQGPNGQQLENVLRATGSEDFLELIQRELGE